MFNICLKRFKNALWLNTEENQKVHLSFFTHPSNEMLEAAFLLANSRPSSSDIHLPLSTGKRQRAVTKGTMGVATSELASGWLLGGLRGRPNKPQVRKRESFVFIARPGSASWFKGDWLSGSKREFLSRMLRFASFGCLLSAHRAKS